MPEPVPAPEYPRRDRANPGVTKDLPGLQKSERIRGPGRPARPDLRFLPNRKAEPAGLLKAKRPYGIKAAISSQALLEPDCEESLAAISSARRPGETFIFSIWLEGATTPQLTMN